MKQFRRRRFLVDGNLQYRLIAASLGYVMFYVFVMAGATFLPLIFELESANPHSYRAYMLANNFIYLHRRVWPIALLVLVAVSLHSLWLSHKVAGPLYRFRRIFGELAAGKLPVQQRLRKRDYLQAEMNLINEVLGGLQLKMAGLQETQKAVADTISRIVQRNQVLSDDELALLVKDLEAQGQQLAKHALLFDREP